MSIQRRITEPVRAPVRRNIDHHRGFFEDLIHAVKNELTGRFERVDGGVDHLDRSVQTVSDRLDLQADSLRAVAAELERLHDTADELKTVSSEMAIGVLRQITNGSQPYYWLREEDITSAYRLLLFRDPTPEELQKHLDERAHNLEYDIYHFVDILLASPERTDALAGLVEPRPARIDGLVFYYRPCDTALGAAVAHIGGYEPEVTQLIHSFLSKGDVFVDVGANIGLHAIRAARLVGARGQVLCFEPNPHNVELLQLAIEANRFDHVSVRPVAASNGEGKVPLHARRGQSNATVETAEMKWDLDVQLDVPSVRLDDELEDLERLDLLKIDIEGAEPLAFEGMSGVLERHRPPILMEVFPDAIRRTSGVDPASFLTDVQSMGYEFLPVLFGKGLEERVYSVEEILMLPEAQKATHADVLARPC